MIQFIITIFKLISVPFLFLGILVGCCWHSFMSGFNDAREIVVPPDEYSGEEPDLETLLRGNKTEW